MRKLLCPLVISAQTTTRWARVFSLHLGARDGQRRFISPGKNVQKKKDAGAKVFACALALSGRGGLAVAALPAPHT